MKDAIDTLRQFSPRIYHNHCAYCGVKLVFGRDIHLKHLKRAQGTPNISNEYWWNTATYDHWIAQSNGGTHKHKVPCCWHCNRQKCALSVDEFRQVFFGGHLEKFWIERMADTVRALPSRPMRSLPPPIPFCTTTGVVDRWEAKKRYAGVTKEKRA